MFDHARPRGVLRAPLVALALIVGASVWPLPAAAQPHSVFEVRDVAVDVTAETAAAARERALAGGEVTAFRRMLERLTLREDHARLPILPRAEVADFVKDFSVKEEKTSTVRYLARLDVRFKAEAVRRLLIDVGVPFAETPSKPVLVLPVYQRAAALLLWDDPNPWLETWKRLPPASGLVPLVLPIGDLNDIAAIGAAQAVDGDIQRLTAVARRYEVDDTLVARAVLGVGAGSGLPVVEVFVTRYGSVLDEQTMVRTFKGQPGEAIADLLGRAAADIARQVEDVWKEDNLLVFDDAQVVAVTVPISGLGTWLTVRRKLGAVAVVRQVDLVLVSKDEVRVNLHYVGDREQLVLALKQADLDLLRTGDDWILKPFGGARTAKDS